MGVTTVIASIGSIGLSDKISYDKQIKHSANLRSKFNRDIAKINSALADWHIAGEKMIRFEANNMKEEKVNMQILNLDGQHTKNLEIATTTI